MFVILAPDIYTEVFVAHKVWPDVGIKIVLMLPKVAQKIATANFTWKWSISKWPKKSPNILGYFCMKICHQELIKIAQSGYTVVI